MCLLKADIERKIKNNNFYTQECISFAKETNPKINDVYL